VKRVLVLLLGLGLGVLAVAWSPMHREQMLMDSLRRIPPKMRMEWMFEKGWKTEDGGLRKEADSGLRLLSKWGRGPAAEVTGRDTLVVLILGSEVALLSFAEPDSPRVLSEIQFPSLTAQSYLEDSLLYTSSNVDLEVWNVSDPTQPVKRGQLLGQVGDFWIRDTFLFYIRRDTFHVLSIANPADIYELGSCIESGSATTGSGNTVVVCQSGGFAFVDVSNPASPYEVSTYSCGLALSATARGNLVCASYDENAYPYPTRFITLDISTAGSPRLLGRLNDLGGFDIFLDGPLAFVSGGGEGSYPMPLQILSIADSAHPAFIDSCRTTNRYPYGIWESANLNRALVADEYDGLAIVDVSNLSDPVLKTWVLKTGPATDVSIDGQRCYVACGNGLRVLDVSDPTQPTCISGLDSAFDYVFCDAVAARDSFAFIGWAPDPSFRTVSVADPLKPEVVAGCSLLSWPEAMVLRDSFVYCAEHYKFQVVNIARPREPVVVGTCGLPEYSYDLGLRDTLAFVANGPALEVVSVMRPATPSVVGTWSGHTYGLDFRDTVVFAVGQQVLNTISVANPAAPYLLDSLPLSFITHDVVVVDSVAYVCGWQLQTVNIANPRDLKVIGAPFAVPSQCAHRIIYVPPFLYVACTDGGVSIYETLQTGVSELPSSTSPSRKWLEPTVTTGRVRFLFDRELAGCGSVSVYDAGGARMPTPINDHDSRSGEIDLSNAPDGVYVLRFKTDRGSYSAKVVKTTRR